MRTSFGEVAQLVEQRNRMQRQAGFMALLVDRRMSVDRGHPSPPSLYFHLCENNFKIEWARFRGNRVI